MSRAAPSMFLLVTIAAQGKTTNNVLIDGKGPGAHWGLEVVCVVVVLDVAGATGDIGEEVVDSSVVVLVVVEEGMELVSFAQPTNVIRSKLRIGTVKYWIMRENPPMGWALL